MAKRHKRHTSRMNRKSAAHAVEGQQGARDANSARHESHLSGGVMFPPGEPIRPVAGIAAEEGARRQWAYPVGYNIAHRPRATVI